MSTPRATGAIRIGCLRREIDPRARRRRSADHELLVVVEQFIGRRIAVSMAGTSEAPLPMPSNPEIRPATYIMPNPSGGGVSPCRAPRALTARPDTAPSARRVAQRAALAPPAAPRQSDHQRHGRDEQDQAQDGRTARPSARLPPETCRQSRPGRHRSSRNIPTCMLASGRTLGRAAPLKVAITNVPWEHRSSVQTNGHHEHAAAQSSRANRSVRRPPENASTRTEKNSSVAARWAFLRRLLDQEEAHQQD